MTVILDPACALVSTCTDRRAGYFVVRRDVDGVGSAGQQIVCGVPPASSHRACRQRWRDRRPGRYEIKHDGYRLLAIEAGRRSCRP
jgi:hypothetical protein